MATMVQSNKTLQAWLYSGIGLIVVSMLFLLRDIEANTFLIQAGAVLAAPAFFYGVGMIVFRYLDAPLAAPGIMATGAWLLAVAHLHLYIERTLLPAEIQHLYWPLASLLVAALLTISGFKARIWLLVPLVLLVQLNAVWGMARLAGVSIPFLPAAAMPLVFIWWENRIRDAEWSKAYQLAAFILLPVMLWLSMMFREATTHTIVVTWGLGALVVAVIGVRRGFANFIPFAIIMIVWATAWGLPLEALPLIWLILATVTVVFVERQVSLYAHLDSTYPIKRPVIELSAALAVVLSGVAAALTQVSALLWNFTMHPAYVVLILLEAGMLLVWLGTRRQITIAAHVGLWLIASAWSELYFFVFGDVEVYGLWLSLLAVGALFIEQTFCTLDKQKRKKNRLAQTFIQWPLADLSLGLTVLVVIWMYINIGSTTPFVVAVTMMVVVGVWVLAGLLYRLPILLHVALWMAPLPYVLLVMQAFPAFRDLQMVGVAWQVLGIAFLVLGHLLANHRPMMRLPFFTTGYGIIGLALLMTPDLLPFTLGVAVVVSLITSGLVVTGRHPTWSIILEELIQPEERPFAFRDIHNFFLIIGTWLLVAWLLITLAGTSIPMARQGIFLVVLSALWVVLGRVLPRIEGAIGWPLYTAGWFMWFIGLMQVFLAPTEALIAIVLGLAICTEALNRTREAYWLPVFVLQILFAALQITWRLNINSETALLLLMAAISIGGMAYGRKGGKLTAWTAGVIAALFWWMDMGLFASVVMGAVMVFALYRYRHPDWLLPLYGVWAAYLSTTPIDISTQGLLYKLLLYTLPGGLMLLALAAYHRKRGIELAGVLLFIGGTATGILIEGLFTLWTGLLLVQLALLLAYGYRAGRRIPFASAIALVVAGVGGRILLANVWLLPLLAGMALMGGALLLETRRTDVEMLVAGWRRRWQSWH